VQVDGQEIERTDDGRVRRLPLPVGKPIEWSATTGNQGASGRTYPVTI
jgi:hypothetical protein